MATWCEATPLEFNEVSAPAVSPAQEAADQESYLVAAAIQQAAMLVLAANSDCHTDGGVEWGEPAVDSACCCGMVQTGIVTSLAGEESNCFKLSHYEFRLLITWDKSRHTVAAVAEEANLAARQVPVVALGLIGPALRRKIHIVGADNSVQDEADRCPSVLITFAVG